MRLTPRELDKLMLHAAGNLAKERLGRGLKLNYPEAVALISAELLERARDGMSVAELMQYGRKILTSGDVMPGVAEMMPEIQIEATFPDGTKLVTVHTPIEPENALVPGEMLIDDGFIELNAGKPTIELAVVNTGDRPVQVGSHYHFFEVNRFLQFDRALAFGKRLDIPSGTAVRFEPGEKRTVRLVELGGTRESYGLNGLTLGGTADPVVREAALKEAKRKGFYSSKQEGGDA